MADDRREREQTSCSLFLAMFFAIALLNPANVKSPEDRNGLSAHDNKASNIAHSPNATTNPCRYPSAYCHYQPRPTVHSDEQPNITSQDRTKPSSGAIFAAFAVLLFIQILAVCAAVAVRRRALRQRAAMLEGVTVHRTRGGWLSVNDSDISDDDEDAALAAAAPTVGLPSYDDVVRDSQPPTYDVAVQPPPPPIDEGNAPSNNNSTSSNDSSIEQQQQLDQTDTTTATAASEAGSNSNNGSTSTQTPPPFSPTPTAT